ncbi:MAG: prolipoprotein diacylglyceryl transferase [Candidatus Peribacteraceae bacterium]|nr:prolipoprotein diacylglyceryl transferase [Candidatus Peribacteraceae bacterium]
MFDLFPSRTVAVEILGFPIHWYGILYVLSFIIAMVLLPRLQRYRSLSLRSEQWLDVISWGIVGVLVGGRLGFVLFYEPSYFLQAPWKIIAVWEGGMSSHGGFIGVAVAMLHAFRKHGIPVWKAADLVSVPAAIGLSFGRMGNFINGELYGTVTDLPWGMAFPGAQGLRHPVQLYAVALDLCIALACFFLLARGTPKTDGRLFAVFLMLYGIVRFSLEFLRDQTYEPLLFLTRGQALTVPLLLAGLALWFVLPNLAKDTR